MTRTDRRALLGLAIGLPLVGVALAVADPSAPRAIVAARATARPDAAPITPTPTPSTETER